MKDKTWLIMLIKEQTDGIYTVTITEDGYVLDNKKKKVVVLKKSTMEELNKLMIEYKNPNLSDDFDSKCMVKFNGDTNKFTSNDKELYSKIIDIVFKEDNIKHPPKLLDSAISLIERLRATGELDAMIQADGKDATIDAILAICQLENE